MSKKKKEASDYSKDAFLTNPVASVNDLTGYSQRAEIDPTEAQELANLVDATVKKKEAKTR